MFSFSSSVACLVCTNVIRTTGLMVAILMYPEVLWNLYSTSNNVARGYTGEEKEKEKENGKKTENRSEIKKKHLEA